jgi:hypothetical protein
VSVKISLLTGADYTNVNVPIIIYGNGITIWIDNVRWTSD